MADYEFYPLGVSSEVARDGINAAVEAARTAGILRGNGVGGINMAEPGADYGYPMLTGMGPPTMFVVGAIGQLYFNLAAASAPYLYVCTDYNAQGYQWRVLGSSGDGLVILGYFSSLDLLQSSVTNPQPGDAYGVGAAAPYVIYIFDGLTHTWKNNGTLGVGGVANGIPPHGATGQALIKRSDASGDVEWGAPEATISDGSITAAKLAPGAISADYTVMIPVSAWAGAAAPYTASVAVPGILATDAPIIDLMASAAFSSAEAELAAWGLVYRATTATGMVTFYATDTPTAAINVQIKVVRR